MLITSMFYTRTEIGERIGWSVQCNGLGIIIGGFLAFGVAHLAPGAPLRQWQALYLITSLATLAVCAACARWMPDNPTTARFLDPAAGERARAVRRVRENQNGIETKRWKRAQAAECLRDYKTWLFFAWAAIACVRRFPFSSSPPSPFPHSSVFFFFLSRARTLIVADLQRPAERTGHRGVARDQAVRVHDAPDDSAQYPHGIRRTSLMPCASTALIAPATHTPSCTL
jgi:MFS family permease